MKKNATAKAFVMSLLALMMCLSMLVGTTFAWFTDSVTSGVNKIVAGNLDVDLVDKDGNSLAGQTLDFVKAEGAEGEEILWEPGCTYKLPEIYIKNNGTLALKYKILVDGLDGDAKLLEAIAWTVKMGEENVDLATYEGHLAAGAKDAAPLVLQGHMKETAGNEYQGLTAKGISITVLATQDTVEHDSFNNTYDENALFDGEIATAEDLAKFLDTVAANHGAFSQKYENGEWINTSTYYNATAKLVNDIDMTGVAWSKDVKVLEYSNIVIDGNGHSIQNLTTTGGLLGKVSIDFNSTLTVQNLTLDNAAVTGKDYNGVVAAGAFVGSGGAVKYLNCHVINSNISGAKYAGGFVGYDSTGGSTPLKTKGCTVENTIVTAENPGADESASAGGFCGYTQSNQTHEGLDVQDTVTVTVNAARPYAGRYYGTLNNHVTLIDCVQQALEDSELAGRIPSGGFMKQ